MFYSGSMILTQLASCRNLGSADEVHSFEEGRMDVVNLGEDVVAGRATFEPGWR